LRREKKLEIFKTCSLARIYAAYPVDFGHIARTKYPRIAQIDNRIDRGRAAGVGSGVKTQAKDSKSIGPRISGFGIDRGPGIRLA
jgi:hypothetical protein